MITAAHVVVRPASTSTAVALALPGAAVLVEAGRTTTWAAVAGAVLWGGAVAVGLMLRDADARRRAGAAEARTAERLRIARELHDVVAHHVTGIVVRAQAARVNPAASGGYADIEEAAKDALTAMRRVVRTLRSDEPIPGQHDGRPGRREGRPGRRDGPGQREAAGRRDGPGQREAAGRPGQAIPAGGEDLARSLRIAIGDDRRGRLTVGDVPALPPRVVATAYWLTLEALTNVRKHAPGATVITVDARTGETAFDPALELVITNDGVAAVRTGDDGFGLVGMGERVREVGGTLRTGPTGDGRWEVAARLPLSGEGEWVIRVLIADDQAMVRTGFRLILEAEDDIEVIGEAADGEPAMRAARRRGRT